jgi:hypothetical protein
VFIQAVRQALHSPPPVEQYWGDPPKKMTAQQVARVKRNFDSDAKSAMRLRAAGIRVLDGTGTGQACRLCQSHGPGKHGGEGHDASGSHQGGEERWRRDRAGHHRTRGRRPQADFIVLSANSLDNISNTRKTDKVYLRGEEVPRAAYAAKWRSQFQAAAAK